MDEPEIPTFVNSRANAAPVQPQQSYGRSAFVPEQQPIAPVDDDRRQGGVGSDVPAYLRRAPKR